MTAWAYYNEFDPFAADTLENLIAAGHIAPGYVDRRSITEVTADDLKGFCQAHFFAGVGVWSLSARRAGIPDSRPIWSGSAPCQPWSAAGAGKGADDERHLWPHWFENIIKECRPDVIFGEQVADASVLGKAVRAAGGGPDGAPRAWFDIVSDDLESAHYSVGAVPFTSAGVGAPHIRDRLYWVADAGHALGGGRRSTECQSWPESATERVEAAVHDQRRSSGDRLVDTDHRGQQTGQWDDTSAGHRLSVAAAGRSGRRLGHSNDPRLEVGVVGYGRVDVPQGRQDAERSGGLSSGAQWVADPNREAGSGQRDHAPADLGSHAPHQLWDAPDWLWCRDGKWRPVESGSQPLAYGLARGMGTLDAGLAGLADVAGLDGASLKRAKAYRVGALRAYGNAINAWQAEQFIRAWLAVHGTLA